MPGFPKFAKSTSSRFTKGLTELNSFDSVGLLVTEIFKNMSLPPINIGTLYNKCLHIDYK